MIELVDAGLKDWAERILDEASFVDVSLSFDPPPADLHDGTGISLYLLEIVDTPPPRTNGRTPLQFSVRYLVTTWASEAEEAHRLLSELIFAAMEYPDFHVEFGPLAPEYWRTLGVVPRPSFMLRVPVKKARPEPETGIVTREISVDAVPTTRLEGVVLTPEDIPLMDMRVELKHLRTTVRTDRNGRFLFPNVPVEPRMKELIVRGKGHEISVSVAQPSSDKEIVEIRFNPLD